MVVTARLYGCFEQPFSNQKVRGLGCIFAKHAAPSETQEGKRQTHAGNVRNLQLQMPALGFAELRDCQQTVRRLDGLRRSGSAGHNAFHAAPSPVSQSGMDAGSIALFKPLPKRSICTFKRVGAFPMQSMPVVDDSPSMRKTASFALTSAGHWVMEAIDGQDAHDKAQAHSLDLVVADQKPSTK